MDMNRAYFMKNEARAPRWRVIDAEGQVVGRLATKIARILRGKDDPKFTPHTDTGDYVVIINAEKVIFTGDKMRDKEYQSYSGYIGGLHITTAQEYLKKDPGEILRHAIIGMLPKTKMSKTLERKLKIYAGAEHPHTAQVTTYPAE
jgi:large subunit ribosomal protein L13